MDKVIVFVKSHWPVILAFGVAAWSQFGTQVTTWVGAHPHLSGWFAFVSFTVAYWAKSPWQSKAA